jgi:hypothetical protein
LVIAVLLFAWALEPQRTEEFVGRLPYGNYALKALAKFNSMLPSAPTHTVIWRLRGSGRVRAIDLVIDAAVKGIIHEPGKDVLLSTIAKARGWIDNMRLGRGASFAEIAERENRVERHIRLLAPLAFLSPRIIAAIADGTAPADLTVTGLAKALPHSWAEQERRIGLHP